MSSVIVTEVKKKGRPKKNIDKNIENIPKEPKKRGRKKKENVVEEVKIKKKRGRKPCVKYFSSSIRKKIPLTTTIENNNNNILQISIKDFLPSMYSFISAYLILPIIIPPTIYKLLFTPTNPNP